MSSKAPSVKWPGLAFKVLYVVSVLLLLELFFRVYLHVAWDAPLLHPSSIVERLYPELKHVEPRRPEEGPSVLLLGGSVLKSARSRIEARLASRLEASWGGRYRIYDLAQDAQTTRDSLFKYQALAGRRFDIVVVYHAINDLRANNCRPERFDSDYAHFAAYELLQVFERHRRLIDVTVTPYVLDFLYHRLKQALFPFRYLQRDFPSESMLAYGNDIKSVGPFERNLLGILDEARRRGEAVLLLSFASYVPAGYSSEAFAAKRLDYAGHLFPIELWGLPANVEKGLRAHNDVIRTLAAQGREGVFFLDMERALPKQGRYFDDICHLSGAGYEVFADELAKALVAIESSRRSGAR